MKKFLPYISALILLSGFAIYIKWNMDDYNRAVKEINTQGSEKNKNITQQLVNESLQNNDHPQAIELLLKLVETDNNDLTSRLKLAALYCETCKHDYEHCEDALWQLNTILAADSTILPAKALLIDLNKFLDVKPDYLPK